MSEIIEVADRVFELEHGPADVPPDEHCRRWFRATQIGGPPLTDGEWRQLLTEVIAEQVAKGVDVVSWGLGERGCR